MSTYTNSDPSSTDLGRQSTLFNCSVVGAAAPVGLSDPNKLCWTANNDTRAVGVDVSFATNGTEGTNYAILVNEALDSSTDMAYQASTLAATSTCRSLAPNCTQTTSTTSTSGTTVIVQCDDGLSWDWESYAINDTVDSLDRATNPIRPISNDPLRYSFSGSSLTSVPLGLALFTDEKLSSQYSITTEFWRSPPNLSQTMDPSFEGLFYAAVIGTFYGALTLPQFTSDSDFFYPLMNESSRLEYGIYSQYVGFAHQCEIAFVNVTYTFVDGVYEILEASNVSPQTYGAWAWYAGDAFANSLSPPPEGQMSVEDGVSDLLWRNVSSSSADYTAEDFRLGLEAAIRKTAAAWLKGTAAPAPALEYQVRKIWPIVSRVPKASLITLVVFNCLYSLFGLIASAHALVTIYNHPDILQISELFSIEGLVRSLIGHMGDPLRISSRPLYAAFVPTDGDNANANPPAAPGPALELQLI